jgi:hypothetical protein
MGTLVVGQMISRKTELLQLFCDVASYLLVASGLRKYGHMSVAEALPSHYICRSHVQCASVSVASVWEPALSPPERIGRGWLLSCARLGPGAIIYSVWPPDSRELLP